MRALIASGSGRYADPWHPFATTSDLLAEILTEAGFDVAVDHDVDHALAALDGVELVVVNAGDPWRDTDERLPLDHPGAAALAAALDRGIGILAMHIAVASLRDYPDWAAAVGAIWVPGASWHPEHSVATIHRQAFDGVPDSAFDVQDERYLSLQFVGSREVVATHEGTHGPEPTAWLRHHRNARVAVDVLGHDERSYQSPEHRDLIRDLARWAAAAPVAP